MCVCMCLLSKFRRGGLTALATERPADPNGALAKAPLVSIVAQPQVRGFSMSRAAILCESKSGGLCWQKKHRRNKQRCEDGGCRCLGILLIAVAFMLEADGNS